MRAGDPMKAKHLEKALKQFAEEGAAKVFKPLIGSGWIVGVVGPAAVRRAGRAGSSRNTACRCASSRRSSPRPAGCRARASEIEAFAKANKGHMAADHDGDPVYMTRLQWDIDRVARDYPELRLTATKEMMV